MERTEFNEEKYTLKLHNLVVNILPHLFDFCPRVMYKCGHTCTHKKTQSWDILSLIQTLNIYPSALLSFLASYSHDYRVPELQR